MAGKLTFGKWIFEPVHSEAVAQWTVNGGSQKIDQEKTDADSGQNPHGSSHVRDLAATSPLEAM